MDLDTALGLDRTDAESYRLRGDCHRQLGRSATIDLLDSIKELGFRRSTLAGLSIGLHGRGRAVPMRAAGRPCASSLKMPD